MRQKKLESLNKEIIQCEECSRLIPYIREVADKKVRRFRDQSYWGKPVPGFGDPEARILIVGLAPAAHGANRTGRMFTGDRSGDWLYGGLYETGFANQPESYSLNDGLQLNDVYIVSVIRCAPPQNKPQKEEIQNCSNFLYRELQLFENAPVILCLGGIAFKEVKKYYGLKGAQFGHGKEFDLGKERTLMTSYHPSQQNTNTGRLKWDEWTGVFRRAREIVKDSRV